MVNIVITRTTDASVLHHPRLDRSDVVAQSQVNDPRARRERPVPAHVPAVAEQHRAVAAAPRVVVVVADKHPNAGPTVPISASVWSRASDPNKRLIGSRGAGPVHTEVLVGAWLPCVGVAFTGHPRLLPKTKHLPRYRSVRCHPILLIIPNYSLSYP